MVQEKLIKFAKCILLLLAVTEAQKIPDNPCPEIFTYEQVGDEWIGKIRLDDVRLGHSINIYVKYSVADLPPNSGKGHLDLFEDLQKSVQTVFQRKPLLYKLSFPVQDPLPTIVEIAINKKVVCIGYPDNSPQPTEIELYHTFYSRVKPKDVVDNSIGILTSYVHQNRVQQDLTERSQITTSNPQTSEALPELETSSTIASITTTPTTTPTTTTTTSTTTPATTTTSTTTPATTTTTSTTTPATTTTSTATPATTTTSTTTPATTTTSTTTPATTTTSTTTPATTTTSTTVPTTLPAFTPNISFPEEPTSEQETTFTRTTPSPTNIKFLNRVAQTEPPKVDICGKIYDEERQRGYWPWLTAIFVINGETFNFQCNGVLIREDISLTAANCFYREGQTEPISTRDIVTAAGRYNIHNTAEEGSVLLPTERIEILHDFYTSNSFEFDLAIVKHLDSVDFAEYPHIRPICAWTGRTNPVLLEGYKGKVVGWGRDSERHALSSLAKEVDVDIVPRKTCIYYSSELADVTGRTNFCACEEDFTGVCMGDSGSGLFIYNNYTHRWELRGIMAGTFEEGVKKTNGLCQLEEFTVYVDIPQFKLGCPTCVN